jgi:hypothetical protein
MRLLAAATISSLAVAGLAISTLAWAGTASAASVEVKDAVARVTVIPEARSDIKVEMLTTNPSLPIEVRTMGDRVIVDGRLGHRIRSCHSDNGKPRVHVAELGEIAWADMPQIVIRTPKDVHVGAGGAVYGAVGKSDALDLSNAGCGDWVVANVAGKMKLSVAGSGDTSTGTAGEAHLRIAGSGDVRSQAIGGAFEVDVAGSGDVTAASVNGPIDVKVAGSGDVKIGGGHASSLSVAIAGSGNVFLDGVADSLKARIAGSGDVKVKQVTGTVSKMVIGSGRVTIG